MCIYHGSYSFLVKLKQHLLGPLPGSFDCSFAPSTHPPAGAWRRGRPPAEVGWVSKWMIEVGRTCIFFTRVNWLRSIWVVPTEKSESSESQFTKLPCKLLFRWKELVGNSSGKACVKSLQLQSLSGFRTPNPSGPENQQVPMSFSWSIPMCLPPM